MTIAVDFRNTYNSDTALSVYTSGFWHDLASLKHDQRFVFIAEGKMPLLRIDKNIEIQQLATTGIGLYDKARLHNLLKKQQADCFVNNLQTGFEILRLPYNKKISKGAPGGMEIFLYNNADDYAQKKNKPRLPAKIIQPVLAPAAASLNWAETESIKTEYSGGRAFFLFAGNIDAPHQLLELLKAFSGFKKWQQSNMQLLIAGYSTKWTESLEEKLQHYKYRADISLVKNPDSETLSKLAMSCYAMLYPVAGNVFPFGLLLALQSGSAVIASANDICRQMISAAEWVEPNATADGFAKSMVLLYKDEKRLRQLQAQMKAAAGALDRRQMMQEVWQCLEK